jgi:hypothetical protein
MSNTDKARKFDLGDRLIELSVWLKHCRTLALGITLPVNCYAQVLLSLPTTVRRRALSHAKTLSILPMSSWTKPLQNAMNIS